MGRDRVETDVSWLATEVRQSTLGSIVERQDPRHGGRSWSATCEVDMAALRRPHWLMVAGASSQLAGLSAGGRDQLYPKVVSEFVSVEREPSPVRRPTGATACRTLNEWSTRSGLDVDNPAGPLASSLCAGVGDLGAIGRPGRTPFRAFIRREPPGHAASTRHDPDITAPASIGEEGDPRSVGRPAGARVRLHRLRCRSHLHRHPRIAAPSAWPGTAG